MISGPLKQKTNYQKRADINYRQLKGLNQSMLAIFDTNPSQFFNEFILGQKREESSKGISFSIGDLVDFLHLDCHGDEDEFNQRFEEKFTLFNGVKGTAQAFVLADVLYKYTLRDMDEEGTLTSSFEERFKEAFTWVQGQDKYKGKTWEKGLEDFDKIAREYFNLKLANIGKQVVDTFQITKAIALHKQLREDEFLKDYINQDSNEEIEVLKKIVIEFEFMGWPCKAEIDFLHIDHRSKKIFRRDLKTSYDNESFEYSYIKFYYYLQNAFYQLAVESFAKENGLEGYEVSPMSFLVLDTSLNCRRPLLYETTEKHVQQGLYGFDFHDAHYRGVIELIDEITWARDNDIWNMSKENFENKGIVKLKEF